MKNSITKRISFLTVLSVLLITVITALSSCISVKPSLLGSASKETQENDKAEFSMTAYNETLYFNGKEYKFTTLPYNCYVTSDSYTCYLTDYGRFINTDSEILFWNSSYSDYENLMYNESYSYYEDSIHDIYLSTDSKSYVNEFIAGKVSDYKISAAPEKSESAAVDYTMISSLLNRIQSGTATDTEEITLSDALSSQYYFICGYDGLKTLGIIKGIIYRPHFNEMYYIPFDKIVNDSLVAYVYGDSSVNKPDAKVTSYALGNDEMEEIQLSLNAMRKSSASYNYVDACTKIELTETTWNGTFWFLIATLGIALPLSALIFSVIKIFGKKKISTFRYYVIGFFALLWLILCISLLLMLV